MAGAPLQSQVHVAACCAPRWSCPPSVAWTTTARHTRGHIPTGPGPRSQRLPQASTGKVARVRVRAGLRPHRGRGRGPLLPPGCRLAHSHPAHSAASGTSCPATGPQACLQDPAKPGVGNEYSARPQQMGAALLGREILNSWAQDTGSRLRFLLRPRKEPEAGAGPPGRGLWGPGTVGRGGPHERAGPAAPGDGGPDPSLRGRMQAHQRPGTKARAPANPPSLLWATGAGAAPPVHQAPVLPAQRGRSTEARRARQGSQSPLPRPPTRTRGRPPEPGNARRRTSASIPGRPAVPRPALPLPWGPGRVWAWHRGDHLGLQVPAHCQPAGGALPGPLGLGVPQEEPKAGRSCQPRPPQGPTVNGTPSHLQAQGTVPKTLSLLGPSPTAEDSEGGLPGPRRISVPSLVRMTSS